MIKVFVFDFGGVILKMLFEIYDLLENVFGFVFGILDWCGLFDLMVDVFWWVM